jgi:hypothetical protein
MVLIPVPATNYLGTSLSIDCAVPPRADVLSRCVSIASSKVFKVQRRPSQLRSTVLYRRNVCFGRDFSRFFIPSGNNVAFRTLILHLQQDTAERQTLTNSTSAPPSCRTCTSSQDASSSQSSASQSTKPRPAHQQPPSEAGPSQHPSGCPRAEPGWKRQ